VAELGVGKSAAYRGGIRRPKSLRQDGIKLTFQSPEGWIDVWESFINGFATLGIVIIEDVDLYGGVDVGNIGLLYNWL